MQFCLKSFKYYNLVVEERELKQTTDPILVLVVDEFKSLKISKTFRQSDIPAVVPVLPTISQVPEI